MRRLPIYFLIDVSESMIGTPIEQVQEGMRSIIQNLRTDPYALETVFVGIIAFAGKALTLSPLTELYKFYPPTLPIGGGTSLGAGLDALMREIDSSVVKTTMEKKGDWKPIVFLFTDGNPTDNYQEAFRRWNKHYRNHANLVAISLGDNVNTLTLAQITENVLLLKDTSPESFKQFFKWISDSIKATSISVTDMGDDGLRLPSTQGINLEKVKPGAHSTPDENFVVLHGRCQTTHGDYLVKYARKTNFFGVELPSRYNELGFRLVGAYPVNGAKYAQLSTGEEARVNTSNLTGIPACPCCGNQLGVVVCDCGKIFCVGDSGINTCPWCGLEGTLGEAGPEGLDISRGLG
ncbi:MAG: VWA domain-containing protein [Muribaculaceae bacterium]|nr:VWA domain-containing protein [Muribaculaceae bacterium]